MLWLLPILKFCLLQWVALILAARIQIGFGNKGRFSDRRHLPTQPIWKILKEMVTVGFMRWIEITVRHTDDVQLFLAIIPVVMPTVAFKTVRIVGF